MNNLLHIKEFSTPQPLLSFKQIIIDNIPQYSSTIFDKQEKLEYLHNYIPIDSVNSFRLKCFYDLNCLDWSTLIKKSILKDLVDVLGPDLLIQKKINLSVQLPGDDSSILPAHTDCISGDSAFQLVVWIPLTNCFQSNSMFVATPDSSLESLQKIREGKFDEKEVRNSITYLDIDVNNFLIFPPTLIHGNSLNTTDSTRISLNFRVKSLFSPYQAWTPKDRRLGAYYKIFNISDLTRWNLKASQVLA